MKTSIGGLQLIAGFEGFSKEAYYDQGGKLTIGYGHLIVTGDSYPHGITEKEAIDLLRKDVIRAENVLNACYKKPLDQCRYNALISFIYNIGAGAFRRSTLFKKLKADDIDAIPEQMKRWIYVNGGVSNGLKNRRKIEAELFQNVSA